ncbi:MAG: hypothetical protein KDJ76_09920, partial [Xanthobacteraceae bacterium]|nr:hypothetical protein [Xanthobacteraceae bacterium]
LAQGVETLCGATSRREVRSDGKKGEFRTSGVIPHLFASAQSPRRAIRRAGVATKPASACHTIAKRYSINHAASPIDCITPGDEYRKQKRSDDREETPWPTCNRRPRPRTISTT